MVNGEGFTAGAACSGKSAKGVAAPGSGGSPRLGWYPSAGDDVAASRGEAGTKVTGWPESVMGVSAAGPARGAHPAADSSKMDPHSPRINRWNFGQRGIEAPLAPEPKFVPRI